MRDLRTKVLNFLYSQVEENKISQIKKNMVQDFEHFITSILEEAEAERITTRMQNLQGPPESPKKGAVNE